jgi:23S rRNA G2445 N2-methylase RlmL
MQYKHVKEQADYSDLASGRVLLSVPRHPAFPVRLASEIFQRCMASRETIYRDSNPCTVYDACCGAAYHLSVLGFLHRKHVREIIASDIDEKAVDIARQNLGLLNPAGLEKRIDDISKMLALYSKHSHREALASAHTLKIRIEAGHVIKTHAFQANATDREAITNRVKPGSIDIVFTDVPYGQRSQWAGDQNSLHSMLDALLHVLSLSSILAIVSDKRQKVSHERYQRVEHFQVGKRRVEILKPV